MNRKLEKTKEEEFQIDTSTTTYQPKREEDTFSTLNQSGREGQESKIATNSDRKSIDSNMVQFFRDSQKMQSVYFQARHAFEAEWKNIIDDESFFAIQEIILKHIETNKLQSSIDIAKLSKINNEKQYLDTDNFELFSNIDNPKAYFYEMIKKKGMLRCQKSLQRILPERFANFVEMFIKRESEVFATCFMMLYLRLRQQDQSIDKKEQTFICQIGRFWQSLYTQVMYKLEQKGLVRAEDNNEQEMSLNIEIFMKELEQGRFKKSKHETIIAKSQSFGISRDTARFYLNTHSISSHCVKKMTRRLDLALKKEICAQCGIMLNLLDESKSQYFRALNLINGQCRGEIKFPEFRNQIVHKIGEGDSHTFKVCYMCNKIDFNAEDQEISEDQPKCIKRISKKQQEAQLRLGHIYSNIQNFEATMYSAMHGDTSFELFNANLGLMVKNLQWRWMQVLSHDQKNRIDEALRYLKQCNHLYRDSGYLSTYELWQEMASNSQIKELLMDKQSNIRNRMFRGYQQNSFVIELPDDEDQGLYLMPSSITESGYDFLKIKDLRNMGVFEEYQQLEEKTKQEICEDLDKKIQHGESQVMPNIKRNTVYYGDKYLCEKLFPTLHFTGQGGYNSTYLEYGITYTNFCKMKLLSVRPFYRRNQDYVHLAMDRKRKEQLIGFSRGFKAVNQRQHEKQLSKIDVMTHRDPLDKSTYYFAQRGSRKIVGSPLYFIARGEEAQAMLQHAQNHHGIDYPQLFITLTLDPADVYVKQINERMNLDKHKFQDPLAENVGFYIKSRATVKMILGSEQKKGIFGRVLQHIERIEFQKRGAPHLHMIIWLDKDDAKRLNDGYAVQATVPQYDEELRELVLKYMKHQCSEKHCDLLKNQGLCKRGYPKQLSNKDYDNDKDIHVYRRQTEEDRWIIPYNPQILKMMKSNCCVERLTERESITYLTKYLSKAEPSMNAKLIEKYEQSDRAQREVLKFLKLGVISIHQSLWLLCRLPLYQASPQVIYLNISTPSQKMRLLKDAEELAILEDDDIDIFKDGPYERYLVRPLELENLTFFQFMQDYKYCFKISQVPKYAKGSIKRTKLKGYENIIFYPRQGQVILSATKLFPNDGERFFFRVYLENVPHRRFRDFHPSNKEKSYYVECIIKNLIQTYQQRGFGSRKFFWEQARLNKARMQQVLLQIIRDKTLACDTIDNIDQHITAIQAIMDQDDILQEDLLSQTDVDKSQKLSFLQRITNQSEIDRYFMKTFDFNQKAEKVLTIYTLNQMQKMLLSEDQILAIERIFQKCFVHKQQGLFFITGGAGVGKTHLIKLLYSLLFNVLKQRVVMTASTGIAAANIFGQTLHSLFNLSIKEVDVNIDPLSKMQKYLQNIDFIFIDEISQLQERTFEKVQEICQRTEMRPQKRDQLFGGKNIILSGDLLQTLISSANPLSAGDLFIKNFEWIILKKNFRQKGDSSFSSLLNRVRIGEISEEDCEFFQSIEITDNSQQFIDMIKNNKAQVISSSNKRKELYNTLCQDILFPKGQADEGIIIKAKDFKTKHNQKLLDDQIDKHKVYIQKLNKHEDVKLKMEIHVHLESPVMITRNYDLNFQMVNGQICILKEVGPGQEYIKLFNPRTKTIQIMGRHTDQITYRSKRLQRSQFAIQVAFANTVHKVQGLAFDHLIVDFHKMFSKGLAYTALSRATNKEGLRIINFSKEEIKSSHFYRDMYLRRDQMWEDNKDQLKLYLQYNHNLSLESKLQQEVAHYDKEQLNEIEKMLSKVDLNVMLETNFDKLQNEQLSDTRYSKRKNIDETLSDEEILMDDIDLQSDDCFEVASFDKSSAKRKLKDQNQLSHDTKHLLSQFFQGMEKMKIQSQSQEQQITSYPFIRWWNNSCYHDSYLHCFYFGIWRRDLIMQQQNSGIDELVNTCKILDNIPIQKEYPDNSQTRTQCERQLLGVQTLRRSFGLRGELVGNEQLKKMIRQNDKFCSNIIKKNQCGVCLQTKGQNLKQVCKIRIDQIVDHDIEKTLKQLRTDGICFPCNDCGFIEDAKFLYSLSCPLYLQIDVNLAGLTPLKLEDITINSTSNQVYQYELFGIVAIDREISSQHYISYLKDGQYDQQTIMKGWWRYNGMDKGKNMQFKCNTNADLQSVMINDNSHRFIPNLLLYRRQ